MSIAKNLESRFEGKGFSFGEALSAILEHNGNNIHQLSENNDELYVFNDGSMVSLSNHSLKEVSMLFG